MPADRKCHVCGKPWSDWRVDGVQQDARLEYRTCCGYTFTREVELSAFADTEPPPDTEPDCSIAAAMLRDRCPPYNEGVICTDPAGDDFYDSDYEDCP